MAARHPYSEEFVVYKMRFESIGNWISAVSSLDGDKLILTSYDNLFILKQIGDPSSCLKGLNISLNASRFRTVDDNATVADDDGGQDPTLPSSLRLDPCLVGEPAWLKRHMKYIVSARATYSALRDQVLIAVISKYKGVMMCLYSCEKLSILKELELSLPDSHNQSSEQRSGESICYTNVDATHPAFRTAPIDATWSGLSSINSHQVKHLFVIMKDGSTMVWRVHMKGTDENYSIEFYSVIPSTSSKPTCVHYQQESDNSGMLITGYNDGSIQMRDIVLKEDTIVGDPKFLWAEKDKIPVNLIKDGCRSAEVIVAKENLLLKFNLTSEARPVVLHRFLYTIKGIHVRSDSIIAVSHDLRAVLMKGTKTTTFTLTEMLEDTIKYQCHGITLSNNAAYCTVMISPGDIPKSKPVIKSEYQAVYVLLKTNEELMTELREASRRPDSSMRDYYDILECIRVAVNRCQITPESITEMISSNPQTRFQQQLSIYLTKLASDDSETDEADLERTAKVKKFEEMLLLGHLNDSSKQLEELSQTEVPAGFWFTQKMGGSTGTRVMETCSICSAIIPFDSPLSSICTNGHAFLRCGHTLLTCGEISHPRCENCLRPYVTVTSSSPRYVRHLRKATCTFCDGDVPL